MVHVERFWCPPDATFRLDDRGYLADPTSFFGNTEPVVDTASLIEGAAVVLLGEPGSGKSTALAHLIRRTEAGPATTATVSVDLGTFGDESRVVTEALRSDEIREWRDGDGSLSLFLDGLDECHLEVRKIAQILAGELSAWPIHRLRLRIACRTADWPVALAAAIDQGFGDARTVELLPLRRKDVADIATAAGVDADAFLRAVEAANVVALAVRPLTLKLLLGVFADSGVLPTRTTELYARGLAMLADEQSPTRRAAGHVGNLTADHRLAVASRLAGLSLFTSAPSIATSPAGADLGDALSIDDCVGGTEPASGGAVEVNRVAVDEVLRTGLFTSRGQDRLGWAHQTYAEHLGARYLAAHINLHQARELLTSSVSGRIRIFPAFRHVAAWLVAAEPDRYGDLVEDDAETFLAARVPLGQPATERVVEAVLAIADRGDHARRWRAGYGHLAHDRLADQLRSWLRDRSHSAEARALAADISDAVDGDELTNDLLDVFLDGDDDFRVRLHAGHALDALPAGADVARLRSLAEGSTDDPDDELKGIALGLLWPGTLATSEVLSRLTPPKRRDLFGSYKAFLSYRFARTLQPSDLPELLAWLLAQPADTHPHALDDLRDSVVRLALEHTDRAEVLAPLAEYAVRRGEAHLPLLSSTTRFGREDPALPAETRRRLLAAVIDTLPDDAGRMWSVLDATLDSRERHPLLSPSDLQWLIDRHDDPAAPPRTTLIQQLLAWRFHPDHPGHAAAVLDLPEDHALRSTAFAYWLTPVELGSDEAADLRRRHEMARGPVTPRRNPDAPGDAELQTQIESHVDAFDRGDANGYWLALHVLGIDADAWHRDEFQPNPTALPRWGLLPDGVRRRLIEVAPVYLERGTCEPGRWLGTNTLFRPAYAGYRALVLLLRAHPAALDAISAEVWGKWAPIVLAFEGRGDEDDGTKRQLVQRCATAAPQDVLDSVRALLHAAVASGETLRIEDELLAAWSDELAALLAETARAEDVSAPLWGQLVRLLSARYPDGVGMAAEAVAESTARADRRERAVLAVRILLDHGMPEEWPVLRRLLDEDEDFMESALLEFAHHQGLHGEVPPLAVEDLGDLFTWLARRFPPEDDPEIGGWVSPRHAVACWRDAILGAIRDDGTARALAVLARARQEVPGIAWAYAQADAEAKALDQAWKPLAPSELRAVAERKEGRYVRDSVHLHAVVAEALTSIKSELQSEAPAVRWLWDERVMQPKLEPAISDFLKNRLDELLRGRAVVIGREVQVRHVRPAGLGDAVDLRIDAVRTGDASDTATVVIEAKGCWNDALTTDITDQLCERYLRDCATTEGIYVVVWFDPSAWSEEKIADWRRGRSASLDWHATVEELEDTAAALRARGFNVTVVILDCSWNRPSP